MINRSINQENNHKAYTLNKRALDKMNQKLKGVNRHSVVHGYYNILSANDRKKSVKIQKN